MSDTPIFDEITETLASDHAIFSLDPAAVLDTESDTDDTPEDLLPVAA